jgi:hypothetical protein
MRRNTLILKNNLLHLANGEEVSEISVNLLSEIDYVYLCIARSFDEIEKINFDQLEQNIGESDCVVSSVPSSDSIKKIEGNLIVENLDRKVYKKITYPIYIKKDSLLSYLKSSEYSWNLKDALKELDFVIDSN